MPNPIYNPPEIPGPDPDMTLVNGVLSRVGGPYVSAGIRQLPTPCKGLDTPQHAVVEVPGLGTVRITYHLGMHRFHKNTLWSWRARWADVVAPPPP